MNNYLTTLYSPKPKTFILTTLINSCSETCLCPKTKEKFIVFHFTALLFVDMLQHGVNKVNQGMELNTCRKVKIVEVTHTLLSNTNKIKRKGTTTVR